MSIKDSIFENKYVEALGDASKAYTLVRYISKIYLDKKFNCFLQGFSEDEIPKESDINRLTKYINDEVKAEFIADTINKVFLANSLKSCLVIGTVIKSVEKQGSGITHEKLLCISALQNMYDVDIKNFNYILQYLSERPKSPRSINYFTIYQLRNHVNNNIEIESLEPTVDKLVNNQMIRISFEVDPDIDFEGQSTWASEVEEYYSITNAGIILERYLKRIR